MKRTALLCLLAAGCGSADTSVNESAATARKGGSAGAAAASSAVETARLTGLWQGGPESQPNQLCMIDKGAGNARFGLVVWGSNLHSCSGAGSAVREGAVLRLSMAGDEPCELAATIAGDRLVLPASAPPGCAYYCGARARLEGVVFTRAGATAADAMKAKDLVGEPLCED